MTLAYSNNAQTLLAESVSSSDTELTVLSGEGDRFPDIDAGAGFWFPLTLIKADGSGYEIVKAVARSDDTITIERGQENTPDAIGFAADDIVSLRMTAEAFDQFAKAGDESLVLMQGLNLATQTNQDVNPMQVLLPGISELTDGLRISFRPTVANLDGDVRIDLNGLGSKFVIVPYDAYKSLEPADLVTDRVFDFQYSADRDRWFLETTVSRVSLAANSLQKGVVQILTTAHALYDTSNNDDDVAFSGGWRLPTRAHVSLIIKDFFDNHSGAVFPSMWTYLGRGLGDVLIDSDTAFYANRDYQYRSLTVNATLLCAAGSTVVIRCTEHITINGTVELGHATESQWPEGCIGPLGAPAPDNATGVVPTYLPPQNSATHRSVEGDGVSHLELYQAVIQGLPFSSYHGGHGRGKMQLGEADSRVGGRGGLILIAPSITLTDSAKVIMPTRSSNTGDGNEPLNPNCSQAGGGMMVIACQSHSVDEDAEFLCEDPNGDFKKYKEIRYLGGYDKAQKFAGASPGHLFVVGLSSNNTARLV